MCERGRGVSGAARNACATKPARVRFAVALRWREERRRCAECGAEAWGGGPAHEAVDALGDVVRLEPRVVLDHRVPARVRGGEERGPPGAGRSLRPSIEIASRDSLVRISHCPTLTKSRGLPRANARTRSTGSRRPSRTRAAGRSCRSRGSSRASAPPGGSPRGARGTRGSAPPAACGGPRSPRGRGKRPRSPAVGMGGREGEAREGRAGCQWRRRGGGRGMGVRRARFRRTSAPMRVAWVAEWPKGSICQPTRGATPNASCGVKEGERGPARGSGPGSRRGAGGGCGAGPPSCLQEAVSAGRLVDHIRVVGRGLVVHDPAAVRELQAPLRRGGEGRRVGGKRATGAGCRAGRRKGRGRPPFRAWRTSERTSSRVSRPCSFHHRVKNAICDGVAERRRMRAAAGIQAPAGAGRRLRKAARLGARSGAPRRRRSACWGRRGARRRRRR